jgi:hypothetical protein
MESHHDLISLFEHDLFGKPVSTFPDHALEPNARRRERLLNGLLQLVENHDTCHGNHDGCHAGKQERFHNKSPGT